MSAGRCRVPAALGIAVLLVGASTVGARPKPRPAPRYTVRVVCTRRLHRRCVARRTEHCSRVRVHRRWRTVCRTVRPSARKRTTTSTHTTTTTRTTTTTTTSAITTTTSTTVATSTTTETTSTALPSRLEVDENDSPYSLIAGHALVSAGTVQFNVYNYGMDDHTFAIVRGTDTSAKPSPFLGSVPPAKVPAGQADAAVTVSAALTPGTYTLFCTLPQHAALGMKTTITVG